MSQTDGENSQHLKLVNQLKLIEDLWQKLYYVKWNSKSFAMLTRLAQDMVQSARARGDDRLLNLIAQLERHLASCATTGDMPAESDRQRLVALIDALRFRLSTVRTRGARYPKRPAPGPCWRRSRKSS